MCGRGRCNHHIVRGSGGGCMPFDARSENEGGRNAAAFLLFDSGPEFRYIGLCVRTSLMYDV